MKPVASTLARRGQAKSLESLRQAKARVDARRALLTFLGVSEGSDRLRLLAAMVDVGQDALANIEGPLATACRLQAKSGRLAPSIAKPDTRAAAEVVFKGRAA